MIGVSKLTDGIDLGLAKKYNPAEVFVDSENSDVDNSGDDSQSKYLAANLFNVDTDNNNALDKLYTQCIGNRLTRVVKRNKSMNITMSKHESVHAVLRSSYDLPSLSGNANA